MADAGKRGVRGWALYDWANSAFATTVMAGLFPAFFGTFWCSGAEDATITFRLGAGNTAASLLVAFLAPVLGAIADRGGSRKRFLAFFAFSGILATVLLALPGEGRWLLPLVLFALATVAWSAANTFYDSLLPAVAGGGRLDRVSALGYSLGYLGGGLLFLVNVLMVTRPEWFGLPDRAAGVRASFLTVAVWWAVFSLPLFRHVREPDVTEDGPTRGAVRDGFLRLARTFREIRGHRTVLVFLAAYWLYIDGVHTVIRMAVDHGRSMGIGTGHLIGGLLLTQFVGFPAALAFGRMGERFGPKRGIFLGLLVYLGVCGWGAAMSRPWEFIVLAAAVGLVQGGVQALSRSLFARLVPAGREAEFFGFYNMVGKYAAVLGPLLMGSVKLATGSARLAILSIVLLLAAGGGLLGLVRAGDRPAPGDVAAPEAGQDRIPPP